MKTLGLIGGMSWESTALYYRLMNQYVQETLGGLHSAKLLIHSFNFEDIASLQKAGDWERAAQKLAQAGTGLKQAGADAFVICTNTMHMIAQEVERAAGIPLIHIADCTGEDITERGFTHIGLLGTQFTMEKPFYKDRLKDKYRIDVIVPDEPDRAVVHRIIYEELCRGIIRDESRQQYLEIMARLKERGAQGIILGCTEIGLLVSEENYRELPLFDTTIIHARSAMRYAMGAE